MRYKGFILLKLSKTQAMFFLLSWQRLNAYPYCIIKWVTTLSAFPFPSFASSTRVPRMKTQSSSKRAIEKIDESHTENWVCYLKNVHRGLYYQREIKMMKNSENCPIKIILLAVWCFWRSWAWALSIVSSSSNFSKTMMNNVCRTRP